MGDDESLVEAVRKFECLWKVRSRAYKDLGAKENAWKAIAAEVSYQTNLVVSRLHTTSPGFFLLFRVVVQTYKCVRDTGRASEINMYGSLKR